jgi:hypothetical protein
MAPLRYHQGGCLESEFDLYDRSADNLTSDTLFCVS